MSDSMVAREVAEMEACADLSRAASPAVVAAGGLSVTTVGDATLILVSRIDVLAFNRIIGLGLRGFPSDAALAEVAYRRPNYRWTSAPPLRDLRTSRT